MPRDRFCSTKEESRRLDMMKQRKPYEGTLAIDVTGFHDLHASAAAGLQGLVGGLDLCSEQRLHDAALLDRKYEALYPDTGVGGHAEQLFGHRSPQVGGATLGYLCGDARIPPPLTLHTPVTPELAAGPRSLKTVDPLTLSRILLDQQVVAMAQMQHLRLLQRSYLASGNPFYLLPENLMPADLEMLWHLKHPGLPLPPAWSSLPWLQDESGLRAADLRMKEADLRCKDIRRYQDHLRYNNKLEKPGVVAESGMTLEGVVDRAGFLRDGMEDSEAARTAADVMAGSDCRSKEKKARDRKTFMENEKQGFSADRVKRDRRWWKTESKPGISEHPHQQNWLETGSTDPSSQHQRNFAMPGYRQNDRKAETGSNEGCCTLDYRKYDWPDGRASLNKERPRKPSENDIPGATQRPSSDPHSRNSDGLHLHGYAFSNRNNADFYGASERVKDGLPLPPPADWFSSMERAKHHVENNVNQFPGGLYKGRAAAYRYSQEHNNMPTDLVMHKSPTGSEAMLQHVNGEMKMLSSVQNSRHSYYLHNRHVNGGTTNDAGLESRDGIGPEAGCGGFVPSQNGARDLFMQQAALSRFAASEAQRMRTQENQAMHVDWGRTDALQKRFYHKLPNEVPPDFPGIPYSGPTGIAGRYPAFLDRLSSSSAVSSPSNSHRTLASQLQMPSLSPIPASELLLSRRANRLTEVINSNKNTKRLKLDIPRSVNSPLPSWMSKSTFCALSSNAIDSFKSFVDHTVQNAFMNEMQEAESSRSNDKANDSNSKTDGVAALENNAAGDSTVTSNGCSGENIPVSDSNVVLTAASSADSLSSHPLSTETSGAAAIVSRSSTLPAGDGIIPCHQETPMSAGSDCGLPLQTGGDPGIHTKFKKTWLRNYLDEDRKLGLDFCSGEYHQGSDVEMLRDTEEEEQVNETDDGVHVNGKRCDSDAAVIGLIDLTSPKKPNKA